MLYQKERQGLFFPMIALKQTEMGMPEQWTLVAQVWNFFKIRKVLPNKTQGNHKAADTIVIRQKVKNPLAVAIAKKAVRPAAEGHSRPRGPCRWHRTSCKNQALQILVPYLIIGIQPCYWSMFPWAQLMPGGNGSIAFQLLIRQLSSLLRFAHTAARSKFLLLCSYITPFDGYVTKSWPVSSIRNGRIQSLAARQTAYCSFLVTICPAQAFLSSTQ